VPTLVLATFPIAFLIFAAMVGIPLWLTFKRPDRAPAYRQATAGAQTVLSHRTAGPAAAWKHVAAHTPVPGRLHATTQRTARDHSTAAQHDRAAA
jgi:hypothetical protein